MKSTAEKPVVMGFDGSEPELCSIIYAVVAETPIVTEEIDSTTHVRLNSHRRRGFNADSERGDFGASPEPRQRFRLTKAG